ncbi:hypothetical protein H8356DRAFT_1715206 [Neocallimastix lanati (nom. inval.)]|nr:hypothetical protein H8356DRAFT_1715206 [Neocallimastix sp. JGI-2020a]
MFIPIYYLIGIVGYAPPTWLHEEHNEVNDEIAFINHSYHDESIILLNLGNIGINFTKLPYGYSGPLTLLLIKQF